MMEKKPRSVGRLLFGCLCLMGTLYVFAWKSVHDHQSGRLNSEFEESLEIQETPLPGKAEYVFNIMHLGESLFVQRAYSVALVDSGSSGDRDFALLEIIPANVECHALYRVVEYSRESKKFAVSEVFGDCSEKLSSKASHLGFEVLFQALQPQEPQFSKDEPSLSRWVFAGGNLQKLHPSSPQAR